MTTDTGLHRLRAEGLRRFLDLQTDAVTAVTARFYATHGSAYDRFGPRGRKACREDLAFHLEFLHPVLEFGLVQPMVDYLCWLSGVLAARTVPTEHLAQSLDWLGEFFAEHMEPADGEVVAHALCEARDGYLAADATQKTLTTSMNTDGWPEAQTFEAALLSGHQYEALAIAKECLGRGANLLDIERHVVLPALYSIGEKWQVNRASVAQEHLATAIAQSIMTSCLLLTPPAISVGKKVLLACVEGNQHVVGLRMVADAFQLGGWQVQYLGANVPSSSLIQQALNWQPDVVALSVSLPPQLKYVRDIVTSLTDKLGGARPAVVLGGLAINRFATLAGLVGADGTADDAQAAVLTARRLLGIQVTP
jgi:methanogenic corrinoid protein MtbC1